MADPLNHGRSGPRLSIWVAIALVTACGVGVAGYVYWPDEPGAEPAGQAAPAPAGGTTDPAARVSSAAGGTAATPGSARPDSATPDALPAVAGAPAARSGAAGDTDPDPAGDPAGDTVADPAAGADPGPARFDLVRVEPDGAALIAGRTAPGATVSIRIDGEERATARADAAGAFAVMLSTDPAAGAQELSLAVGSGPGAEVAAERVLILPPSPVAPPRGVAGEAPARPGAAGAPAEAEAAAEPGSGPPDDAPEVRNAPAVVLAGAGAVRLLQPSGPVTGTAARLALDAVSYGESGALRLSGRAGADEALRLYVDGAAAAETRADAAGAWALVLDAVAPGRHRLRVDALSDDDGSVTARIELPFQRDPASLAEPGAPAPGMTRVVVQPGHSLWRLARDHLGDGVLYTQIFTANSDRIRDADLIYPGQVFDIPAPAPGP